MIATIYSPKDFARAVASNAEELHLKFKISGGQFVFQRELKTRDIRITGSLEHCDIQVHGYAHVLFRDARLYNVDIRANYMGNLSFIESCLRYVRCLESNTKLLRLSNSEVFCTEFINFATEMFDIKSTQLQSLTFRNFAAFEAHNFYPLNVYDPRGYRPIAVWYKDSPYITAGCRWLLLDDAIKHWTVAENFRYVKAIQEYIDAGLPKSYNSPIHL